jgi:hypothetical protein
MRERVVWESLLRPESLRRTEAKGQASSGRSRMWCVWPFASPLRVRSQVESPHGLRADQGLVPDERKSCLEILAPSRILAENRGQRASLERSLVCVVCLALCPSTTSAKSSRVTAQIEGGARIGF